MTYSTLMVHLDGAGPNEGVLDAAATLAKRFDAKVIGIAACQPAQLAGGDSFGGAQFAVLESDIVTKELAHAEGDFHAHTALQPHVLEWRSVPTLDNVTETIAELARRADLIITAAGPASGNFLTHADTGRLIMRSGRPVLVVPSGNVTATFQNVVVAWADTPECRRAIADALPILHGADRVILVEASKDPVSEHAGIDDCTDWLKRHGIGADCIVSRMMGSPAETLGEIATQVDADLLVAGAYGHSRIREWAFGGVTRDLLLHERRCTMLSH